MHWEHVALSGEYNRTCAVKMGDAPITKLKLLFTTDLAAPLAGLSISPDMKLYTHTIFSPDIYFADLANSNRVAMR